ncbi:MAG: acetoacetate--CoA ligase [Acidobacteriota bacterium]
MTDRGAIGEVVWRPSAERVAATEVTRFLDRLTSAGHRLNGRRLETTADLWRWSVTEPSAFWAEIWNACGVVASRRGDLVVDDVDRLPGARWFPEARLNFAENLLRFADDREALVAWGEDGRRETISFAQLARRVERIAAGLAALGVGIGDRVAGLVSNGPEAVVAMLATARLGAVWTSCSPDFGARAVVDRFGQTRPKVLIAVDGYRFGGRAYDLRPKLVEVVEALDLEALVVVPALDGGLEPMAVDRSSTRVLAWSEVAEPAADLETPPCAQLPFDHPLYILYSSGTTGLPKCMVHGAGGTLLQHLKELVLHTDLRRGDRIFYFTTCGWMMWNWLVSSLAVGATVVLYDGSPIKPRPEILFDLAQDERVTVFGTSAKHLAMVEKEGLQPRATHDLSALRTILSTGSPLLPESYDFVYRDVAPEVQLASISGGTDIVSCFALGDPTAPVRRGELQTLGFGMRVEVFDADGRSLVGEPGELVCTRAFPSMPVAFWDDPDGARYRAAYFDTYPGVWHHGDWAEITEHGGLVIHGRSDATLNPGGVRIGTAEIYRQVEAFDEVVESLVVGREIEGDVEIVLFVVLREGVTLDEALIDALRRRLRSEASPFHVPKRVLAVGDLPRTRSGKLSELAVREALHGRPVRNRDALANPEALDAFADLSFEP